MPIVRSVIDPTVNCRAGLGRCVSSIMLETSPFRRPQISLLANRRWLLRSRSPDRQFGLSSPFTIKPANASQTCGSGVGTRQDLWIGGAARSSVVRGSERLALVYPCRALIIEGSGRDRQASTPIIAIFDIGVPGPVALDAQLPAPLDDLTHNCFSKIEEPQSPPACSPLMRCCTTASGGDYRRSRARLVGAPDRCNCYQDQGNYQ
ncbi:hypothetical protein Mycsm_06431 [Mycobacterium sp. JS623]|nr:hypothetical protein Mycsm_06431 [Mycobacterium sp. JS623]